MEGLRKSCSVTLRFHKSSGGNTDLNIRAPSDGYERSDEPIGLSAWFAGYVVEGAGEDGGVFTAQCNGTLYLYLNTDNFDAGTGQYNVTFASLVTNVPAGAYAGIAVGTVTNGGTYSYSASGFCTYDTSGDMADPNGNPPTNGTRAVCSDFNFINITNAICPHATCFSLVGRIQ
jgi:hypothetical protein